MNDLLIVLGIILMLFMLECIRMSGILLTLRRWIQTAMHKRRQRTCEP